MRKVFNSGYGCLFLLVGADALEAQIDYTNIMDDSPAFIDFATIWQSPHQPAIVGDTVVFEAVALGYPPPLIQWQFNNSATWQAPQMTVTNTTVGGLSNVTAWLTLANVRMAEAGLYTVKAYDGDGSADYEQYLFDVTPAVLTIAANNASRTYGAVNPSFNYTPTGFVNGDNSSVLSGSPSLTTPATAADPVGPYPILAARGTLSAVDYTFNFVSGTLTVNQAVLTIAANNASRVYGSANPPFTGTIVGVQNNDPLTATYICSADYTSPAGTYDIEPQLLDPAGRLGNYSVTLKKGTLTITPMMALRISIGFLPSGQVQLHLQGSAGVQCTLETSSNLTDWVPWMVATLADGSLDTVDSETKGVPIRFYRVVVP